MISDLQEKLKQEHVKLEQSQKRISMFQKDAQRLNAENKKLSELLEAERKKQLSNSTSTSIPSKTKEKDAKISKGLEGGTVSLESKILKDKVRSAEQENIQLKAMIDTLSYKTESSDRLLQDLKIEKTRLEKILEGSENERVQLLHALESFEQQMSDVYDKVVHVSKERDNIAQLYKQVNEQLLIMKASKQNDHDAPGSPSHPPLEKQQTSASVAEVEEYVHELEKESELLRSNEVILQNTIKNLNKEIDSLKQDVEELVVTQRTSGSNANQAVLQLEHELGGLKNQLRVVDERNKELQLRLGEFQTELQNSERLNDELKKNIDFDKRKLNQVELDNDKHQFKIKELESKSNGAYLQ
jgi:chromosome segregation ATPase